MSDVYKNDYECETCGNTFSKFGDYEAPCRCDECNASKLIKPYDSVYCGDDKEDIQ